MTFGGLTDQAGASYPNFGRGVNDHILKLTGRAIGVVSSCSGFRGVGNREVDCPTGHDGGNRVLVNHLRYGISEKHDVLVERFNLALQLDAVDQIDRYRYVLPTQNVQERVLQKLPFIAHDILRVQVVTKRSTLPQAAFLGGQKAAY